MRTISRKGSRPRNGLLGLWMGCFSCPIYRRLRTSKRENFDKFVQVVDLMELGKHLTVSGLLEIAKISETMNHRKPSEVVRILRDHTPASFLSSQEEEDMVRALRRRREASGND